MSAAPPPTDDDLLAAAVHLGQLLRARRLRVATAESSTGGLIGHLITEVSGSSAYYVGGIVSYSNEVKERTLGVPPQIVMRHGAVSAEVAVRMATGVRDLLGTDLGVAVTGIAGPEGGSADKPVGLTFIATASTAAPPRVERRVWPHDRAGNKRASAVTALVVLANLVASQSGNA